MGPEARPELRGARPPVHGGGASAAVLDFSTGVSPLPAPSEILRAAREADLSRYPDPTAAPLRAALARLHDTHPDQVVAGAGAAELIWAVARAFAGPGRRGVVLTPAFGEYERALRLGGAEVELVPGEPPAWQWRPAALAAALARGAALVYLCRPSNPCLNVLAAEVIHDLAGRFPGTLFVVDEAYLPLFEDVAPVRAGGNVAVVRSLTKVFALPGLRLGYLLASRSVAGAVQASLPSWNVSAPAQAAGNVAAELLPAAAPRVRDQVAALRRALERRLSSPRARLEAAGGTFLLYRLGAAEPVCAELAARGILLRHAASFGLPDHVRLGVRAEPDQERLAHAWHELLGS